MEAIWWLAFFGIGDELEKRAEEDEENEDEEPNL